MKLPRRQFLHLAVGAASLPAVYRIARAQDYPSRPVHIIVGFAPAGPNDITARLLGQWLSDRLGQPFIIDNRPGAGSNIAAEAVVKAQPDGYTLLMVSSPNAINATLYERLNFNFIRDIAPVASIMRVPNVMEVNPSFPARTVPEFIAYAKANSGKLNFASSGVGASNHMSGELFKVMTGISMAARTVSQFGRPRWLICSVGQVQVMFDAITLVNRLHQVGKLRALAVTTATRSGRCRISRLWVISYPATRSATGLASARRRTRPSKSSIG